MSDSKVTDLAPAGTLDGTEILYGVQGGLDVQLTTGSVADLVPPTDLSAYYTSTQTDTAIAGAINALVAGAPAALDTLDELAAALADDASFSATVMTAISTKVTTGGALGAPSSGTLTNCTGLPLGGLSGLGTGVATALAINVGTAGSIVTRNGALGTPSSGTLTNCTGLPVGSITGLGTGIATFLATPNSANLLAAMVDKTGTGLLVFADAASMTALTSNTLTLTGSVSSTAWATAGIRFRTLADTYTDTSTAAAGTVAVVTMDNFSASTIDATNAITVTNLLGAVFRTPTAGANVTVTNPIYAAGMESCAVGIAAIANLTYVIAGTTMPAGTFNAQAGANRPGGFVALRSSNTTGECFDISFARSRGNVGAKTVVVTGNILGRINFLGYDGTDFGYGARIQAVVTETTPGAAAMGTRLDFMVSPAGTETPVTYMALSPGQLTITPPTSITTAPATNGHLYIDASVDYNYASILTHPAVRANSAISINASGSTNVLLAGTLFWNTNTITDNSTAVSGPYYTLVDQKVIIRTVAGATSQGFDYSLLIGPTWRSSGAGTFTITSSIGASFGATFDSRTVCTSRVGVQIGNATVANTLATSIGVITSQAGLAIADITTGTNLVALLLGTTTIPTGSWNIYQSNATPNRWNGAMHWKQRSISAATTLLTTDHVIVITGGGAFNLQFPAASSGKLEYIIRNDSGGTVTMTFTGADTGTGTMTIATGVARTFVSDGTSKWYNIAAA